MSYEPTVARDFYLVRDVCAVTGLSKASVYAGIEEGELPGYKVGNRYVIPGPAFRALCAGTWEPRRRPADEPRPPVEFVRRVRPLPEQTG